MFVSDIAVPVGFAAVGKNISKFNAIPCLSKSLYIGENGTFK